MKNLKKVLALVLAFACAFTMFAGALTFSDVKPGDDYSAAITMLSDLEVISGDGKGNYNPTGTITRAEACVLIANMMNGGKADTARFAGGSNFSDVPKTYWGESAIAYCVQNGVTYGVGGGKFAPTRQITDAEFVAMVTRAMGYDTAANPLSFPYGNYTAAVNNGIVDNVPYVEGSPCTRGEAAQIIYDCLFADYARYTANQNVIHNANDEHDTNKLIEVVFGLTRASNVDDSDKSCTQHYFVITGYDCDEKTATIDTIALADKDYAAKSTRQFECDFDITPFVGNVVVLWGETEHGNDNEKVTVVKAIETVDGQKSYDYNPTMDWEDDLDLDEVKDARVDGVKYTDKTAVEDIIETKNGYSYKLVDWDDDKEIDYVVTYAVDYYEVSAITSKQVKLVDADGKEVYALDLDGKTTIKVACDDVKEHTVKCEIPEDLEKGDIVSIDKSDLCEYENEVVWVMDIVEPVAKEVTKIEAKSGKVYFDDEYIDVTDVTKEDFDDATGMYGDLDEDSDTEYDLWLNANGFIIKLAASDETYGYLFVRGQGDGNANTNKRKLATLDVTFDDGNSKDDVEVAKDATITMDGVKVYDKDDREFTGALVGRAFKYQADEDGVITKLVQVATTVAKDYSYNNKQEKITVGANSYWMEDCDVIFVVKADNDATLGDETVKMFGATAGVTYIADDQIKAKNVKVVEYTDLPAIGGTAKTDDKGVQYNDKTDTMKAFEKCAVLGVDTFKYFDDIDTTIALVTEVTYKTSTEKYTVSAIIPGEGEQTFTAKEGDLDDGTIKSLQAAKTALNDLEMIYAELETVDGALIAFNNNTTAARENKVFEEAEADFEVGRFIMTKYNSKGELILAKATSTGDNDALPQLSVNTADEKAYKFADDVAFYELDDKDDDNNLPVQPAKDDLYLTLDGFYTDSVKKLSDKEGVSYYNDKIGKLDEGEYYMADVVINDEDEIVMIVYFPEVIEADYNAKVEFVEDAATIEAQTTYDTLTYAFTTYNATADKVEVKAPAGVTAGISGSNVLVAVSAGLHTGDEIVLTLSAKDDDGKVVTDTLTITVVDKKVTGQLTSTESRSDKIPAQDGKVTVDALYIRGLDMIPVTTLTEKNVKLFYNHHDSLDNEPVPIAIDYVGRDTEKTWNDDVFVLHFAEPVEFAVGDEIGAEVFGVADFDVTVLPVTVDTAYN